MGYYINGIGISYQDKVNNLVNKHGAVHTDSSFKENLVCVVDNGVFAAAGYAFSSEERDEFNRTNREKTWLVVPDAANLAGY